MSKTPSPEIPSDADRIEEKAEALTLDRNRKIEEYKSKLEVLLESYKKKEIGYVDEYNTLKIQVIELEEKIKVAVLEISRNLNNPSAIEGIMEGSNLAKLKDELKSVQGRSNLRSNELWEISRYIREIEEDLGELNKFKNENEKLKQEVEEFKTIDAEVGHLQEGLNGELEASRRKMDEDIESLVSIREGQLKTIDKAEQIEAIYESLDKKDRDVFMEGIRKSDQNLYHNFKRKREELEKKHDQELLSEAEKQDPALMEHKKQQEETEQKERFEEMEMEGGEHIFLDKAIKKYIAISYDREFRVGQEIRLTFRGYAGSYRCKIIGFTEVEKNLGGQRRIIVATQEAVGSLKPRAIFAANEELPM